MSGLIRFFIRKIIARFITFFVILTLTFIIPRLLPGGAFAYLVENPNIPPDLRQVLIKQFGLDKPLLDQYLAFFKTVFYNRKYRYIFQQASACQHCNISGVALDHYFSDNINNNFGVNRHASRPILSV